MINKNQSSREISINIIISVLEEEKLSHIVLREALGKLGNSKEDNVEKAFITRLSQGTVEKKITLDYIIDEFSKTKTKKMKPFIRNLLRMSVYQIMYMDSVPDSAVCNEAVKLAKKRGFVNLSGFVNGILRNISRNKDEIKFPDIEKIPEYGLSIKYSIPEWIINRFIRENGYEKTLEMLDSLEKTDEGITVRVNTSKEDKEKAVNLLKEEKVSVKNINLADNMLKISDFGSIDNLKTFKNGIIQPQDVSSALVVQVSGAKEGDICIDMCGAPGGKTIHLADMLKGKGQVYTGDLTEKKVGLIKENILRCGFDNVRANVWDATIYNDELYEMADVVIADVPCSGLGVIRHKSDIKYRLKENDIEELAGISRRILDCAVKYIKKGGTLIFSTCTMTKEENADNRKYIMEELNLKPVSITEFLSDELLNVGENKKTAKEGYLKLLLSQENDGFFISKYIKY